MIVNKIQKFFGVEKPVALEWNKWDDWYDAFKADHPILYFFTETVPEKIKRPYNRLKYKLGDFESHIINRFISKTHCYPEIKPGDWAEYDTKVKAVLLGDIVRFVEVECAWKNAWSGDFKEQVPKGWLARKKWKCPAAGIAYLEWEMSLIHDEQNGTDPDNERYHAPTYQAEVARKILEIYNWYTVDYPATVNYIDKLTMEVYGRDKNGRRDRTKSSDRTIKFEEIKRLQELLDKKKTEYMVWLVQHRHSVWT